MTISTCRLSALFCVHETSRFTSEAAADHEQEPAATIEHGYSPSLTETRDYGVVAVSTGNGTVNTK
jgi:hypothetical protein